jgi:hypothetical protein
MQSGSIGLSQKLSRSIDGASVVATSPPGSAEKWTEISISHEQALASVLRDCAAARAAVLTGANRPLPRAANQQREYVFLDLSAANQILHHQPEDQVISVQTGITLQELNGYLMPYGQWFPVSAPGQTTLLDLINRGNGGLLEHGFGAIRDLILGLELVTGGGASIKSGGIVVKNVTGYDTTKLFVGSHATLAIAHAAHLRLYARPAQNVSVLFHSPKPEDLLFVANDLIGADLSLSCCELIDLRAVKSSTMVSESNVKLAQQWGDYGLLVRVFGHEELLKEILPQIRAFKIDSSMNSEISLEDANNLSEICSIARYPSLELSASVSQMNILLKEWWSENNSPVLQYRPATGRATFYPQEATTHVELTESLRFYLSKKAAPNTVAISAGELEYEIDYLGSDIKKIGHIKASLKERFDPSRCLNPLAVL